MTDVFEYLDDLCDMGFMNMYGAGPYLQEEFGIDKYEAREALANWMRRKDDS